MTIRRECCNYCMWLGPVNQDGTMRKHRPATSEDRFGRKIQNRHEDHCQGSHKPYARFGCDSEETTTVNDPKPTARTAADLPKGTRVTNPEGRTGTVNGVDVGRIAIKGHANYGREYVGVEWDAVDGDMGLNRRSRPFVDELTIATTETPDVEERVPGTLVDPWTWIRSPMSTRRLATSPNEVAEGARHGETAKLHRATCESQSDCASHNVKDKRGGRGLELGAIPTCEPSITYGAWSERAGGFINSGDCATEVANWAADELRTLAEEDDTDTIQIFAICPDHEEQPKNGCEECDAEGDDA